MLSQEKIAFPGILKYFSSCLGDSTDVLLLDFISERDTTMIHLESQKADLNLSPHFSHTVHYQISLVQARNLFIYNAAPGGFQVFETGMFQIQMQLCVCQGAESPHQGFLSLVSLGFPGSPAHCKGIKAKTWQR